MKLRVTACIFDRKKRVTNRTGVLLAGILASSLLALAAQTPVLPVPGQSPAPAAPKQARAAAGAAKPAGPPSRYQPNRFAGRAGLYYSLIWGVDGLGVKSAESGELIRFSYHVVDAAKAKALNDKKLEPSLLDPEAGVKLVVPSMEQVGQLRQTGPPQAGKSYWMAFSNKGRMVKPGDRVNVVIGQFHADGLMVE